MLPRMSERFAEDPGVSAWEVTGSIQYGKVSRTVTFTVRAYDERRARDKVRALGFRIDSSKEVTS